MICSSSHAELPTHITVEASINILNIQCEYCFIWCIYGLYLKLYSLITKYRIFLRVVFYFDYGHHFLEYEKYYMLIRLETN